MDLHPRCNLRVGELRAYVDNPGQWMAHCHILEHAEMGMMAEVMVTPDANAPPMTTLTH